MKILRIFMIVMGFSVFLAEAQTQTFVRDYNYHGDPVDTLDTCRISAIDGVKRELMEELGTYVESVVRQQQDGEGNAYMSHDVVTISAGITALKVLKEDWNKPNYYIKASMKADPDEVMQRVKELRSNLKLENSLRESQQALEQSRAEVASLRAQLASNPANRDQLVKDYMNAIHGVEVEELFQRVAVARKNGNFVAALKELRILADKGYPKAQIRLGMFYDRGLGVEQDYDEAMQWYQKALQQGEPSAAARFGWLYEHGLGVPRDYQKAAEYYRQAIKGGSPLGYAHMGYLYETGKGVEKNHEKAAEYYRTSMDMGNYLAMARLGFLYQAGLGVTKDENKAVELYRKAAEHGQPAAMARLGQAYNLGLGDLEVDHDKAISLIRGAVRYNLPMSYALLGLSYDKGYGVSTDYERAIFWYKKAAEAEAPLAELRLGVMYLKGIGVERDRQEARRYLQRSADHGNAKARKILERMNNRMGGGMD